MKSPPECSPVQVDYGAVGVVVADLGRLYRNGDGVSQDCTVARTWYEEAAANNNTAMMMLGELYDEGCHGFRHDKDLAQQWYSKAAEAGNEQAKEKLHALK